MIKMANYIHIPDALQWYEWLYQGDDRGCSGIHDGCTYCIKRMYQKRSTYLTSYMKVFIDNKDNIVNNAGVMPVLQWYSLKTAKSFYLEGFHLKKCTNVEHYWLCKQLFIEDIFTCIKKFTPFHNVNICSCDAALLLRCCYGYIKEGQEENSLDQIWGRYKNMRKKYKI
jgi:hypothetical protein